MSARLLTNGSEEQRIKRLLRRSGSRQYFRDGGWTEDPHEAKEFSDAIEVAETCAKYNLQDVELAIRYHQQTSDLFCTSIR